MEPLDPLLHQPLRTQLVASLGLAPLSLVFFQQVSLVGFVANLVAIPLVTLAIVPLSLLGIALPPLWALAAALVQALVALLQWLAGWPLASWTVAAAPAWGVAAGLAGGALLLMPLLGLLGTLSGLVSIFATLGNDPVSVARGIAEALNTTIVGLAVAVVLMAVAATFIAKLLAKYPWITWVGLAIILYVAADMMWRGSHEVLCVYVPEAVCRQGLVSSVANMLGG